MKVDRRRVRTLREGTFDGDSVVYVMSRDFRASDNWALLYAQEIALAHKVPLCVLVHFGKNFIETNERQHRFLIDGLEEVARDLEFSNIPFFLTFGDWKKEVAQFVQIHKVGAIVTDFSPLHEMRWWWDEVSHGSSTPIYEVDAHNIVPCFVASDKEEYAAYTLRRKLRKLYDEFKGNIPKLKRHPHDWGRDAIACWPRGVDHTGCTLIDWNGVRKFRKSESDVAPVNWYLPGEREAHRTLERFRKMSLKHYGKKQADLNSSVNTDLSPYIRFGFLSAQRALHEIEKVRGNEKSKRAFLEELFVRRELAENFCFYNEHYNNFEGLRDWAKETLTAHEGDEREYAYTFEEFEAGKTHDSLWNAAQMELVKRGKMHDSMSMYWAKKILEWSATPEDAVETAIKLNDRYSLDGRDPNGYAGILSSIGGLHDRPRPERPIYGKIRYINEAGCRRKFDVKAYTDAVASF